MNELHSPYHPIIASLNPVAQAAPSPSFQLCLRLAICLVAAICSLSNREAVGADRDGPRPAEKLDLFGDPLPAGAVARLGTLRFRPADVVNVLVLSADGKTLASAGNQEVCLWDLASGKKVACFVGDRYPFLVAFAEAGKTLISVDTRGTVRFRNIATGKMVRQLQVVKEAEFAAEQAALTPDGRFLAVRDDTQSVIGLWDLHLLRKIKELRDDSNGPLAISSDGRTIAAGNGSLTMLWDVASGKPKRMLPYNYCYLNRLGFSPDGNVLVSAGGHHATRSWSVARGKVIDTYGQSPPEGQPHAFSADGKLLATTRGDTELLVWDLATNQLKRSWRAETPKIQTLVFSRNGKTLITAGTDSVNSFVGHTWR